MAAPTRSYLANNKFNHVLDNVGAAAATIDLPAPPTGMAHVIDRILLRVVGAITLFRCDVIESGGANMISRVGEQATVIPQIDGPIIAKKDDATKITVTTTGGTGIAIGVLGHLEII